MMILRKSSDRGGADFGWLKAKHTFSFGDYYDPNFMGFRSLRVINEDRVAAGEGFPTHGHRDMEIVTYIISGAIEHKDSMGNGSVIRPGDLQYMSAGTGVRHSEFNPEKSQETHLLQIWIEPDKKGYVPEYAQTAISDQDRTDQLRSVDLPIRQDAKLFVSILNTGKKLTYTTQPNRGLWIQIVKGQMNVVGHSDANTNANANKISLSAGDAVAIENESNIELTANENTEFLLFDLY